MPVEETNKNDYNLGYWRNNSGSSDNILACTGDLTTTSCTYSTLKFLHAYSATRTVDIVSDLGNGFKKKKTHGGDILLMWAEKIDSSGNVAGHETDH